ncbi:NADPH2 dehydrogenase [Fusarium napiforme]|uniref:NADPH2 dehydrogenase n=1 Tax=Fusarium napiforme TaxID=42672 RepID=A0A8H5I655_9HYPO|nr:NADPH2 dehydrogenase [Fusarium napiforme]
MTDHWADRIKNFSRLHFELLNAISQEVRSSKVAICLIELSDSIGMGMNDHMPTFTYILQQLRVFNIVFLDSIETRIRANGYDDRGGDNHVFFAVHAWGKEAPSRSVTDSMAGLRKRQSMRLIRTNKLAIIFGRHWAINIDLPFSAKVNVPIVKYGRPIFNRPKGIAGYNDSVCIDELAVSGGTV